MADTLSIRADRAAEETQARRRRQDGVTDASMDLKLSIPDAVTSAHPGHVFCWANDTGARIHNLTVMDDWDAVEGIDPRPVGSDDKGSPIKAILLKKPKSFYDEDEGKAETRRRDVERGQVRGAARAPDDDAEGRYVPKGNRIGGVS